MIPASSRRGRDKRSAPLKRPAIRSGDTMGFGVHYPGVELLADPVRGGIGAKFANRVAFDIGLYREQPWGPHEGAIREFGEMGLILTALLFVIGYKFWASCRWHAPRT